MLMGMNTLLITEATRANYYVQIFSYEENEFVREVGPLPKIHVAEIVDRGVNAHLNQETHYSVISRRKHSPPSEVDKAIFSLICPQRHTESDL